MTPHSLRCHTPSFDSIFALSDLLNRSSSSAHVPLCARRDDRARLTLDSLGVLNGAPGVVAGEKGVPAFIDGDAVDAVVAEVIILIERFSREIRRDSRYPSTQCCMLAITR